jgi:transmembrane sensor
MRSLTPIGRKAYCKRITFRWARSSERLARYRRGYLACDPDVADLRVMGAFPLTDTDKSLAMLARVFPVRIHRRFSWWVTVEKR